MRIKYLSYKLFVQIERTEWNVHIESFLRDGGYSYFIARLLLYYSRGEQPTKFQTIPKFQKETHRLLWSILLYNSTWCSDCCTFSRLVFNSFKFLMLRMETRTTFSGKGKEKKTHDLFCFSEGLLWISKYNKSFALGDSKVKLQSSLTQWVKYQLIVFLTSP